MTAPYRRVLYYLSSANIIGSNKRDAFGRSLTYTENKVVEE